MSGLAVVKGLEADVAEKVRQLDWAALSESEAAEVVVALESIARIAQAGCAAGCAEVTRKKVRSGRSTGSAARELGEKLGIPSGHVRRRSEAGARSGTRAGRAAAEGAIAPDQEAVIAKAVDRLPRTVTPEQRAGFEDALVGQARSGAWRDRLTTSARSMLYEMAPEAALSDEAEQRRRRNVRVSPADHHGVAEIGISADPVLRALIDATLAQFGQPGQWVPGASQGSGRGDEAGGAACGGGDVAEADFRTPGQRAHDALSHVLRLGLETTETSSKGVATIVVSVTPEQLDAIDAAERAERDAQGDAEGGAEVGADSASRDAERLADARRAAAAADLVATNCGTTMSARQAVGMAGGRSWFVSCLARGRQELKRVDVDANPRRRLATVLQRLVLYAAHGGCTYPRCERPAATCQAHHVREFSRGGPTTTANLGLVCPTHHGWVGESGAGQVRGEPSAPRWRTVPDPARPGKPRWIPPGQGSDVTARRPETGMEHVVVG